MSVTIHEVEVVETVVHTFLVRGAANERQADAAVTVFMESDGGQKALMGGQVTAAEKKGSPVRRRYSVLKPQRRTVDELELL